MAGSSSDSLESLRLSSARQTGFDVRQLRHHRAIQAGKPDCELGDLSTIPM